MVLKQGIHVVSEGLHGRVNASGELHMDLGAQHTAEDRTVVECVVNHPEHVLTDIDNDPRELEPNLASRTQSRSRNYCSIVAEKVRQSAESHATK